MKLPKMVKVRQMFHGPHIENIEAAVFEQLEQAGIGLKLKPGARVAVTAGSRGIANIALIIRSAVRALKQAGASPFIVPAMGSHGGATAEGQTEVLHSLGVTEAYCEAPILSSMDVVQIGETESGLPVYTDKYAWEADAVLLVGRVKLHTDFKSPLQLESGLMKMAAIGLGKHKQALQLHSYGVKGIRDLMPLIGEVVLSKVNVLCGLAIVENAFDQTAHLEAIPTDQIAKREPELLQLAAKLFPKLPVEDIDILVVDEIGKNVSGTGMDTNIIGRLRILGEEEPPSPRIKYVIAGDLSEESHGNALGIGLADLTTKRLFDKIDFQKMNENVITSSFLTRAAIPIVLKNDQEALEVALRCNWGTESSQARIVRIHSTLHLETMYVSESLLPDIVSLPNVEVIGEPEEVAFDETGNYVAKV
ncbi:nickel pincer cofactor-dependent isomerase, group 22 [Paenibacillus aestuarii]|uniref:Lactate racemase domain-containing protein n=1 Tax=Paenibacillus aestuarii TaxID=516965 RepID=A0ABW0KI29_9BACL|nr:lactate racemase domain-containing protein [Paenibacillus aestuarii]